MKKRLKSIFVFRFTVQQIKRGFWQVQRLFFCLAAFWRSCGGKGKYSPLLNYKNAFKGQRCFIVATGPSLTLADAESLSNEITFGLNSIVLALGQTQWRPSFYAIQDALAYKKLKNQIENSGIGTIFMAGGLAKKSKNHVQGQKKVLFPLDFFGHRSPNEKYYAKFSKNCYARVYDGYSIVFTVLQLAAYMGFKYIYLIGADCNFSQDVKYFKGANYSAASPNVYFGMEEKLDTAYSVAKIFAQQNGIYLANASRSSKLKVLPKISLDEVLCKNQLT